MSDAIESAGAEVGQDLAEGLHEMAETRGWNDFMREKIPDSSGEESESAKPDSEPEEPELEAAEPEVTSEETYTEQPPPTHTFFKERATARDALQAEIDGLKQQLQQLQQPQQQPQQPQQPQEPQPRPDFDEDPRAYLDHRFDSQRQELNLIKQALVTEYQNQQRRQQQWAYEQQQIQVYQALEARAADVTADYADANPGYKDRYKAVRRAIEAEVVANHPPEARLREISKIERGIIEQAARENISPGALVDRKYHAMRAGLGAESQPPPPPPPRPPADARIDAAMRAVEDGATAPLSSGGTSGTGLPSPQAWADGRVTTAEMNRYVRDHGIEKVRDLMSKARILSLGEG
jgi:hypothetical protein